MSFYHRIGKNFPLGYPSYSARGCMPAREYIPSVGINKVEHLRLAGHDSEFAVARELAGPSSHNTVYIHAVNEQTRRQM